MSWVGIDLGGTKIYAVVFDGTDVLAEAKTKTPTQGGPLAVVDAMASVVRDLGPIEHLAGVGVGAPGVIDPVDEGTVRRNPECPVCGDHPTITEYVDYVEFCNSAASRPEPALAGGSAEDGAA